MYSTYVILIHVYMYAIQRELSFSHYIMILLECDVTHGGSLEMRLAIGYS